MWGEEEDEEEEESEIFHYLLSSSTMVTVDVVVPVLTFTLGGGCSSTITLKISSGVSTISSSSMGIVIHILVIPGVNTNVPLVRVKSEPSVEEI